MFVCIILFQLCICSDGAYISDLEFSKSNSVFKLNQFSNLKNGFKKF